MDQEKRYGIGDSQRRTETKKVNLFYQKFSFETESSKDSTDQGSEF